MNGNQEVPPVVTEAPGSGFASISPEVTRLHCVFAVDMSSLAPGMYLVVIRSQNNYQVLKVEKQ